MKTVLVANRGAVASRVIRALRKLGLRSVAVYSQADAELPYVAEADVAVALGAGGARDTYLNQDALLQAALAQQCDGVHPGYGFLSENAGFARRVEEAGLVFIGPSPRWIALLGDKIQARDYLAPFGMPMLPSSTELHSVDDLRAAVAQLGLPVLLKPSGGGGGIGMSPIHREDEIESAWTRSASVTAKAFGNGGLYVEKLAARPRHIEFQILADRFGNVRCLFERDCSVQRRRQKVVEESPAGRLPADAVKALVARLEDIFARIGYDVIGTVEMLYDDEMGFSFLEVNTRLQVEHAVTEEVTGVDLVAAQILLAGGARLDAVLADAVQQQGHAIEARIYAEDPVRFYPSCGTLQRYRLPQMPGVRIEAAYREGNQVTPLYDPMLAKIIVHADDRPTAIARLQAALAQTCIEGVKTNIPFVLATLAHDDFLAHRHYTNKH